MNLRWIYDTFFLRDALAIAFPGAVFLAACLLLIDPTILQDGMTEIPAWLVVPLVIAAAYLAGLAVFHLSVVLGIATDHNQTLFANPDNPKAVLRGPSNWATWATLYPHPYGSRRSRDWDRQIRSHYDASASRCNSEEWDRRISRQALLKMLCGNSAAAIGTLAVASLFVPEEPESMSAWLRLIRMLVDDLRVLLSFLSVVLLIAHYRHARLQSMMLATESPVTESPAATQTDEKA